MAGSLTNFAEDLVLKWLLTTGAATRPTVWYVGLFTAAPGEAGGGTEVAGGAYARQAVTFSVSGTAPTKAVNTANIEFPTATANWGSISYAAIFDASSGGNMIAFAPVLNPVTLAEEAQTINTGNIFRFNASDLEVDLD